MSLENGLKRIFLLTGMLILMLFAGFTARVHASWTKNADGTYSFLKANGSVVRSKWIDKTFYVDEEGIRLTGKQKINSKWYYFSFPGGRLQKNKWIADGQSVYYAGKKGVLCTKGIFAIEGDRYLFGVDAAMRAGECTFRKKKYYLLPESGQMLTDQWVNLGGSLYYFGRDGAMVKGKWLMDYTYYIDTKGRRVSDRWVGQRYVGSNGKSYSGLHRISGVYYYFSPKTRKKIMDTDLDIGGKRWHFDSDGKGSEIVLPAPGKGVYVEPQNYTHPLVDDETLLSYIIYCEAGNQPYAGKLAVGYVIMNRVYSKAFPASTVREVVYQRGQFGPVWNSAMDRVYKNPSLVNAECRAAAKEIIEKRTRFAAGQTVKLEWNGTQISFPYLYFLSPGEYSSRGFSAPHIQIGGHVFFSSWR